MMAFQSLTLKLMVIGSLSMIGCTQKEFKVSRKLASNRLVVNAESGENPVGVIGSDPTQTPVPTMEVQSERFELLEGLLGDSLGSAFAARDYRFLLGMALDSLVQIFARYSWFFLLDNSHDYTQLK